MILSDLERLEVVDAAGERLGRVVDARFALTGPPGRHIAGAELVGLVVGPRSGASYRGYERLNMNGPRAIAAYITWRHRGTFVVLWKDVKRITPHRVELRDGFTRYSSDLPPA
ncbi:hypothetical protein SAMN04489806_0655 [Paramicrobacterium humi]|uniref:PRC-barrel domain-containing protein n=1 Tax=Paramicrobacterium humi TaxID=640635 RepID=A0A1H4JE60_9MICO|nr:PRC-barrel domain-containing protein [Microbacterium humi]SEB44600.1 hypothetical protein SAMN04489806_0655 [Microbacterium humi]